MASATFSTGGGCTAEAGPIVYPASAKAVWATVHSSIIASASSATNLATPLNGNDTNQIWVRVPAGATRCMIRGRALVGLSAITNQPIVYVYGMYTASTSLVGSNAIPTDATPKRIDITDPATTDATGLTLTFAIATDNKNMKDATYIYSNETAMIDCKMASYVSVLVSQAGSGMTNGGTGATAPTAEICFGN